ncbi:sensor histidine kinase [Maledivibacter halophilus]|nr:HAMP domain-containing sensor histidine kinase [Maledivibacter halophilus]
MILCFFLYIGLISIFIKKRLSYLEYIINCIYNIKGGDIEKDILIEGDDELAHLSLHINELRQELAKKQMIEDHRRNAQNSLLASISHDLRTPLTSLIGYLEILSDNGLEDNDKRMKYTKLCLNRGLQLNDLVNSAFEYFYLEGEKTDITALLRCNSTQNLISIINQRLDILEDNGFTYTISFKPYKYALVYDIRLIERLFDNIFTNIIRYGDHCTTVTVTVIVEKDFLQIVISNGVNPKNSLYTVNSTGIGLMNCKKIMELHKGEFLTRSDNRCYKSIIKFPIQNKG